MDRGGGVILTLGPFYSKKFPQMPPNPVQGRLVYENGTTGRFYIFEIIYDNGGDSGGGNYALKKHTFFFNLKMALNI